MNNLFFLFLGIICGTFTGLFPGVHPNNIVALSFLFIPYFESGYVFFLIGMVVAHYFINYVPTVFLGVPDDETATAVFPMHRLTLRGLGYEAVFLSGFGAFLGIVSSIFVIFVISFLNLDFYRFYSFLKSYLPFILALVLFIIVIFSRSYWALVITLLSGIFGVITLYKNPSFNCTLTAIFTGMFGIPILINNLKTARIPHQIITFPDFKLSFLKSAFFGSVGGFLRIFLPGVGGAQVNYFLSKLIRETDIRNFIVSQGSITLANEVFSIFALFLIGTGRSGVAKAIKNLNIDVDLFQLIPSIIIASSISFVVLLYLSKFILLKMQKINFKKISIFFIFFCTFVVVISSINNHLFYHLTIYLTAISIGILCLKTKTPFSYMMSVLIFPTILYFLSS
ncbi:tripartite tricarboxylate transporter permease [Methanotorris igneus]|uniref:tripartite tricarboxylate transporter permease n=1 Tax=Methanotorris igneus TaxID=2189 RepID=UPI00064E62F3|nr:tripartite tricarboxylate transporter permease [Methanotorris igneus]